MPVTPSDGPPKRNANDVFLSAKDLAAAFQLGFDADKAAKAADDFDRGSPWSGPAHADAARSYRRPRRKRRTGRKILLVLVLLVLGAGAFVALNLRARTAVTDWAHAKWMALTGENLYPDLANKGPAAKRPAATRPPAPAAQRTSPAAVAPVPSTGEPPDPLTTPDAQPSAAHAAPSTPARIETPPASQPAAVAAERTPPVSPRAPERVATGPEVAVGPAARPAPTTVPSPSPATVVPAPSVPRPAPPQSQPAAPKRDTAAASAQPTRAEPAAPRMTHEEAQRKSRELWNEALDAEERGDYRKAKELYQTIMATLPRDVWYQGIEARLKVAKDVLGEK